MNSSLALPSMWSVSAMCSTRARAADSEVASNAIGAGTSDKSAAGSFVVGLTGGNGVVPQASEQGAEATDFSDVVLLTPTTSMTTLSEPKASRPMGLDASWSTVAGVESATASTEWCEAAVVSAGFAIVHQRE